jgi:carbon storage regulator CsrA
MLVLGRQAGTHILVGEDTVITVCSAHSGRVKIGVSSPDGVKVKVLRWKLVPDEKKKELKAKGVVLPC